MEKLNILRGKMFWFLVCFALSALFFVLQYPIIGGIFMIYPVVIVLISMVYGFIINPYKEHQITKTIRNADGFIGGFVKDENGNAIQGVRIGIYDPNHQSNVYLSQCYGLTDNIAGSNVFAEGDSNKSFIQSISSTFTGIPDTLVFNQELSALENYTFIPDIGDANQLIFYNNLFFED
jgi:hypothetical protein